MANILVIDDEEQMRDLLDMMLTDDNHSVKTASDGVEGLLACHHEKFDLIITDINMPHKNGIDFLIEIQKFNKKIPVIAISGAVGKFTDSEFNLASAKMLGGVLGTLKKPFNEIDLRNAINAILGESK